MNLIPRTEREKKLLILLGTFFIFVFIFLVYNGFQRNIKKIYNQIQKEKQEKEKIVQMQQEYLSLDVPIVENKTLDNMENKIISLLENFDLKSNTGRINPTVASIDNSKYLKKSIRLNIQEASALEVMNFIREIEYSSKEPKIQIESFTSRENVKLKTKGLYSFSITFVSFMKK